MARTLFIAFAGLHIAALPLAAAKRVTCNRVGWDAGRESFASTDDVNYPGCSNACFQRKKCKSFAYSSEDCQLYDRSVKRNFVRDDNSPYSFYDTECEKSLQVCGEQGTFTGGDLSHSWVAEISDSAASERTALACYNACASDPSCKSYAWTVDSCTFYDVPLSGNFDGGIDSDAQFYDLSCGEPQSADADTTDDTTTGDNSATTSTEIGATTTNDSITTITNDGIATGTSDEGTVTTNVSDASLTEASTGTITTPTAHPNLTGTDATHEDATTTQFISFHTIYTNSTKSDITTIDSSSSSSATTELIAPNATATMDVSASYISPSPTLNNSNNDAVVTDSLIATHPSTIDAYNPTATSEASDATGTNNNTTGDNTTGTDIPIAFYPNATISDNSTFIAPENTTFAVSESGVPINASTVDSFNDTIFENTPLFSNTTDADSNLLADNTTVTDNTSITNEAPTPDNTSVIDSRPTFENTTISGIIPDSDNTTATDEPPRSDNTTAVETPVVTDDTSTFEIATATDSASTSTNTSTSDNAITTTDPISLNSSASTDDSSVTTDSSAPDNSTVTETTATATATSPGRKVRRFFPRRLVDLH